MATNAPPPQHPDPDRFYDAIIGIAERRLSKADLAQLLRELFG